MAKRIPPSEGLVALHEVQRARDDERTASRQSTATAVRYLLQMLADAHPGQTVEVRVPPFGAVQCIAGPRHTRGTPPNVIEMAPDVWIALATGELAWSDAVRDALVSVSGTRASLEAELPLPEIESR